MKMLFQPARAAVDVLCAPLAMDNDNGQLIFN